VETLRSLVQMYGSVTFEMPGGIESRLSGLGGRVEPSKESRDQLATLGAESAAAVW
jgi:hypothetical protein